MHICTYFEKDWRMLILDPNMPHLPHFGHNYFPQKIGPISFYVFIKPQHHAIVWKK